MSGGERITLSSRPIEESQIMLAKIFPWDTQLNTCSARTDSLASLAVSSLKLSSTKRPIRRILLVDGMELIRVGLVTIISAVSNLVVCAATGDYDEVEDLIERHRPHLMIAEPFHENRDGIMWIKELTAKFPQSKILVASSNAEATYASVSCARGRPVIG